MSAASASHPLSIPGVVRDRDVGSKRLVAYYRNLYERARRGRGAAQWEVGVNFAEPDRAFPRSAATAVAWFTRAVDSGYVPAMNNLAFAYLTGQGVRRDARRAIRLYEAAIAAGDVAAMCNLGRCLIAGRGVARDVRRGVALLRRSAVAGYYFAAVELANLYEEGAAVRRSLVTSVVWLRTAARLADDADDAGATRWLALAYETGRGVPRSSRAALRWMRAAAEGGDLDACRDLGWYYQQGIGTPIDGARAMSWYRKVKDATSAFNIAILYLERDARRAASRWFARAASMGHARSREYLVTRDSKLLLERPCDRGEPGRRR